MRRLIPAHAGKTYATRRDLSRPSAHPRSRGENMETDPTQAERFGSSPLTRGKLWPSSPPEGATRLIPAHAGKTQSGVHVFERAAAHPRSRGENRACRALVHASCGSSPLTRGKRLAPKRVHDAVRLIPAHAGKTLCGGGRGHGSGAHPRSRGENVVPVRRRFGVLGSSPLTRGKPV